MLVAQGKTTKERHPGLRNANWTPSAVASGKYWKYFYRTEGVNDGEGGDWENGKL